jgi:uncharacterized protein YuzE
METLKMKKPKQVTWDYDQEADILYISFGEPKPALTLDLGGGVLARYLEKTKEFVGFTIIGISQIIKRKSKIHSS